VNPRDGRFRGRSVIVTGAGGDIGAATALRLAAEGAHLALFDRRLELVEDVAGRCQDLGGRVHAAGVDQTDRAQVEAGVAGAVEALGALDGLFANAGYGRFSTFLEQSQQEWQRHVDVNLTGTFNVCQAAARVMVSQRRGGVIVVNASSGATQYTDLLGAYCATKAALGMLVIGMASELGAHRIRVNAVLPGVIETGMTAPMLEGEAPHRDVLEAATPVGRLGSADDIANAVAFLASDEAAFVTGHSIAVDGGQTIHGHPQWYRTDYRDAHQDGWRVEP
jgi:NAD(P)-dependent dehydrogenase (short-subunit alcohol dehydrogenase family)